MGPGDRQGHFGEVRGDARVTYTGAVSGRLAITAASVNTRNRKRDEHLRSADFFELRSSQRSVWSSPRRIPIKGISHPLPLHATVAVLDDGAVRVLAQTIVDREQLGVNGNLLGKVGATTRLWPSAVAKSSAGDRERRLCSAVMSTRRISPLAAACQSVLSPRRATVVSDRQRRSTILGVLRRGTPNPDIARQPAHVTCEGVKAGRETIESGAEKFTSMDESRFLLVGGEPIDGGLLGE